jgi:hypothetical protein
MIASIVLPAAKFVIEEGDRIIVLAEDFYAA